MARVVRIVLVSVLSSLLVVTGPATVAQSAKAPVVTRVGAGAGPVSATTVVVRGKRLAHVTAVKFGSRRATVLKQLSTKAVRVRTPRGMGAGTVSVRVRTPAGWSARSSAARYTFVRSPVASSISADTGSYAGGETVTITGRNLALATRVTFGSTAAQIEEATDDTVTVTVPAGIPGVASVRVKTPGGRTPAAGLTYAYTLPPVQDSVALDPASTAYIPQTIDWVTGGLNPATGVTSPWVVGLPAGTTPLPQPGDPLVVPPGAAAFPSGLAGSVSEIAVQADDSVRVRVQPTDVESALEELHVDYSGPVVDPQLSSKGDAKDLEGARAAEFSLVGPTAIFCRDKHGQSVSFGADLSMSVVDVDVSQRLDVGSLVSQPSYSGAFTAELKTEGTLTVKAAATCKLKPAWQNAHRRTIPLGTTGATVSFAPTLTFKVTGKGTWTIEDRTRTTYAVDARLGQLPRFSRSSRNVISRQGGALSFEAEVSAGVSVQLGVLDRAGLEGKVELGVTVALEAKAGQVCVKGELFGKISVGVFLDVWVARWEAEVFSVKLKLRAVQGCAGPAPPATSGEPEIVSARLPDASIGEPYEAWLTTADDRDGTWALVSGSLPVGLTMHTASGLIDGTPAGPVGERAVVVQFTDAANKSATTTIRIAVLPPPGIGGGDLQFTLRWSGAADLDLHVVDPLGEEVYYANPYSDSGGQLDHDANAGCNGPADDDAPVENILWPTGVAPSGGYWVWVNVFATCDAPLDWHLTARRRGVLVLDVFGTGDSSDYLVSGPGKAARGGRAPSHEHDQEPKR